MGKKGQINFSRFRIENLKCSASFCCLFVAGGWVEFLPTRAIPLDSQILSRTNSKEIFPFPIPPITQTAGDSKPRSSFRDGIRYGKFGRGRKEERSILGGGEGVRVLIDILMDRGRGKKESLKITPHFPGQERETKELMEAAERCSVFSRLSIAPKRRREFDPRSNAARL